MTILLLILGLALLSVGGDVLVRGATGIATRLGVSPLLIGLTLVGFGTSTPELVTSFQAAAAGSPGIAVGNVVGSNIANVLLILGLAAAIAPIGVERGVFARDGGVLGAATLALLALCLLETITRPLGGLLAASLFAYVAWAVASEKRRRPAAEGDAPAAPRGAWPWHLAMVVLGIAATILGARWLVGAAIEVAASLGVPETVIGLTVVAVGTSLPELVTSVAAALRGQGALAFGNVVGSNIYNILFILGVTGLVQPVVIPASIAEADIWILCGVTVLLAVVARTGWRISRGEGAALLAVYGAYVVWLLLGAAR